MMRCNAEFLVFRFSGVHMIIKMNAIIIYFYRCYQELYHMFRV